MRTSSLACVVALSAALLAAAGRTARADASAEDRETSRGLYAEGMKALDAADYRTAARACRGAYKLVPLPTPAVCLARALVGLGKLVEARDVYLSAARSPVREGEPAVISEARTLARTEAEKLVARIPTLTLAISGAGDTQLHGSIDGADVSADTLRLPRKVDPGRHTMVVGADGHDDERVEVEVGAGETKRVPIELHATSGRGMPTAGWIAIGIGATGVVVGSVFGGLAFKDKNSLDLQCKTPTTCPASAQPDLDTLRSHTLISTLGFVVGAVGIGAGIVLWRLGGDETSRKETPKTEAALSLGAGWIGVRGAFR